MFCVSCLSEHLDRLSNSQKAMEILERKGGLPTFFPEF
jgi:hypothetical protein